MKYILCLNDHIADLNEEQTERLISSLPEWRREQALRYKQLQGRKECAIGYVELLRGLRERFDINEMPAFAYKEHGKPYLKEHPDIHFSISHCKLAVGCLLSDCPCGLDVESVRSFSSSVVSYAMNADEVFRIQSASDPAVEFIRLWTQKEAILKCKGTGIAGNLKNALDTDSLRGFELETIEKEGYIYSTATLST